MPLPSSCPHCGSEEIVVVPRAGEYIDGESHIPYPDEVSQCSACGEEFYTYEQSLANSRAITAAVAEANGFLTPERIRRTRVRLGMSQPQFEQSLGVGPKTVGRWERGTVSPGRAANFALWVAEQHPEVFLEYAAVRGLGFVAPRREAVVVGQILAATSGTSRPVALTHEGAVATVTTRTSPVDQPRPIPTHRERALA